MRTWGMGVALATLLLQTNVGRGFGQPQSPTEIPGSYNSELPKLRLPSGSGGPAKAHIAPQSQSQRPDDSASKLEVTIVGILRADGKGVHLDVRGVSVNLVLNQRGKPNQEFTGLLGQQAVVRGLLFWRPAEWTCDVTSIAAANDPKESKPPMLPGRTEVPPVKPPPNSLAALARSIRDAGEAIVGYRPGRLNEAREACLKAGLTIKETYGQGQFFVCRWKENAVIERVIAELRSSPAINYIEPNGQLNTQGGADKVPVPKAIEPENTPRATGKSNSISPQVDALPAGR